MSNNFTLDSKVGCEIEYHSNDDAQISFRAESKSEKLILTKEIMIGEYCQFAKYFIIKVNANGDEISRVDALSVSATTIKWKESQNE